MPTPITPTGSWSNVYGPAPGEGIGSVTFNPQTIQPLANRDQYLYNIVDITNGTGIGKIRTVSYSVGGAAIKAIANPTNGAVVIAVNSVTKVPTLYIYNDPGSGSPSDFYPYQLVSNYSATGSWIMGSFTAGEYHNVYTQVFTDVYSGTFSGVVAATTIFNRTQTVSGGLDASGVALGDICEQQFEIPYEGSIGGSFAVEVSGGGNTRLLSFTTASSLANVLTITNRFTVTASVPALLQATVTLSTGTNSFRFTNTAGGTGSPVRMTARYYRRI